MAHFFKNCKMDLISIPGLLVSIIAGLLALVGYFAKRLIEKFDELIEEVKKLNGDNVQHGADIKYLKEKSREHTLILREHAEQIGSIRIELAGE